MDPCWVLLTAEARPRPVFGRKCSPLSFSPGLCAHILSVFSCSSLMTVISAERDVQTGSVIQAKICFSTCRYLCEHPLPFSLSTVVLYFLHSPLLPVILFCSVFHFLFVFLHIFICVLLDRGREICRVKLSSLTERCVFYDFLI